MTAHIFKIGQTVRLRSTARARHTAGEYQIVVLLSRTNEHIRYRIRSSTDERHEMVVKESELFSWPVS